MEKSEILKSKYLDKSFIKKWTLIFFGISIISLFALSITNNDFSWDLFKSLNWKVLLLGIVLMFNDLIIGGWRNHIFFKLEHPNLKQKVCFEANLACIFMGSVTPSQTGGGPAQWYLWLRNGITVPQIVKTSFINLISTVICLPLFGALALKILKTDGHSELVVNLTKFGFSAFTTVFTVIALVIISPFFIDKVLKFFGQLLVKLFSKRSEKINTSIQNLIKDVYSNRQLFFTQIKEKPQYILYSLLLTLVLYANKFIAAYCFSTALGYEVDFISLFAVMSLMNMILYFSPTPGGSGIAEVSMTTLFSKYLPTDASLLVTLLIRFFFIFMPSFWGAVLVLRQLKKEVE
jgi:glycosyltransferase 2 family protein